MSEEEAKKEVLKRLKEDILNSSYPPVFDSDTKYYIGTNLNCYAYALQFKTNLLPYRRYFSSVNLRYSPGVLSVPDFETNLVSSRVFDYFLSDLYLFNIYHEEVNIDDKVNDNEYKIAVYRNKLATFDFHFIRENKDGIWSHKNGMYGSIEETDPLKQPKYYVLQKVVKIWR